VMRIAFLLTWVGVACLVCDCRMIADVVKFGVDADGNFGIIAGAKDAGKKYSITQTNTATPITGTLGAGNGAASGSFPNGNGVDTYTLTITTPKAGGGSTVDTFKVKVGNSKNRTSVEEGAPNTFASLFLDGSGMGVFASTGLFFFTGLDGELVDQFNLTNSSGSAFEITSLQLYENLNPAFFSAGDFFSGAAIASGSLSEDVNAEDGNWTLNAGDLLMFDIDPAPSQGYELLVGSARQVLPDGSLGLPFSFAFANAVPEPGSLPLLGGAVLILLLGNFALRRVSLGRSGHKA
jgi:hypothetical protein